MWRTSRVRSPGGWRLALVAGLAAPGWLVAGAHGTRAAEALTGAVQTVYLEYKELGSRVCGWGLKVTPRDTPFTREPDWGSRHVCRGTINSASHEKEKPGVAPGQSINLPFAWDYTRGALHLDANRNGDLTDDPVHAVKAEAGSYFYQSFTNLHLTFPGDAQLPRSVDLALYAHQGRSLSGGTLSWRSFWQGKAVLGGRECQVGLIEHPNHVGSTVGSHLLLRPWEARDEAFELRDGLLVGFEFSTNLFACGRAHRLACVYAPGDAPQYRLELTEQAAELGEVELTGKFLRRVVFREHQEKAPFVVVLDRPEGRVRIPVGTYKKYWAALKVKDREAFCHYRDWLHPKPVTIVTSGPTVLPIGGPLTNEVGVAKRGRTLTFVYMLRGAGGEYRLAGPADRTRPPHLSIHQNGQPVAAGRFEFG